MFESISLEALDQITGGTACGGCGCGCDPNAGAAGTVSRTEGNASGTVSRNKPLAALLRQRRLMAKLAPQAQPDASSD